MLNGSVEATIAIVFGVVALGPIIAERLRIPGLIGLIAGGVIFGPFVIGWLDADGLVEAVIRAGAGTARPKLHNGNFELRKAAASLVKAENQSTRHP